MPEEAPLRVEQWDVLRHLLAGPLAVGELAAQLSRTGGSVTRSLTTLQGRGLVDFTGEHEHTAPNRPKGRWTLTKKGRSVAKKAPMAMPLRRSRREQREHIGVLERHQGFLTAKVTSDEVPALLELLSAREQAADASFVARLDGDGHDYLFIFEAHLGASPAEGLATALSTAKISVNTGVIADVRSVNQLVADARGARDAARLAISRRGNDRAV